MGYIRRAGAPLRQHANADASECAGVAQLSSAYANFNTSLAQEKYPPMHLMRGVVLTRPTSPVGRGAGDDAETARVAFQMESS